jgi:hypothetical protein
MKWLCKPKMKVYRPKDFTALERLTGDIQQNKD